MLASPESILASQPQRKSSQPFLSLEEQNNLRNSHISPGGLVNSNPSSNDVVDEVRGIRFYFYFLFLFSL